MTQVALGSVAQAQSYQRRRPHIQSNLLASVPAPLPKTLPVVLPVASDLSEKIKKPSALQSLIRAIPKSVVTIQSVQDVSLSQKAPVLLVQDIHMNIEAQTNIATLLQNLIDQKEVELVGVEGAFGPFEFNPFRLHSNKAIADRLTKEYFNDKRISAPSFVGVTSKINPPMFVGVDDKRAYEANVAAYLNSKEILKSVQDKLFLWDSRLRLAKQNTFSPALKAFDDLRSTFHQEKIGLGAYVQKLQDHTSLFGDFLTLSQFAEAYRMETRLNMEQVERERQSALEHLVPILSEASVSVLMAQNTSYREGHLSFGDYYRYLKSVFEENKVLLSRFPHFSQYLRYVLLADGVSSEKLFDELAQLELAIAASLAVSDQEKVVLADSEKFSLSQKLVRFALTSKEWAAYKAHLHNHPPIFESIDLKPFEDFYIQADHRSITMVENMIHSSPVNNNQKAKILVVGGFHTELVSHLLQTQNISYLVVSPKVTKIEDPSGSAYLSVFSREKTALEKLFSGEKLFLSPPTHLQPGQAVYDRYVHDLNMAQHRPNFVGGQMNWLKELTFEKLKAWYSELTDHQYDVWVGPALENILVWSMGGVLGWHSYTLHADPQFAFVVGVVSAWGMFVLFHVFDWWDEFHSKRDLAVNMAFAIMIGSVSTGLAFLPFPLALLFSIQLIGSYLFHGLVNKYAFSFLEKMALLQYVKNKKKVEDSHGMRVFQNLPRWQKKRVAIFAEALHHYFLNQKTEDVNVFEHSLISAASELGSDIEMNLSQILRNLRRPNLSDEQITKLEEMITEYGFLLNRFGISLQGEFYGNHLSWKIFRLVGNFHYTFSPKNILHYELIHEGSELKNVPAIKAAYATTPYGIVLYQDIFRQDVIHEYLPVLGGAIADVWGLKSVSEKIEQACKNFIHRDLAQVLTENEVQLAMELGRLLGQRKLIRSKSGPSIDEARQNIQEQLNQKKVAYNKVVGKISTLLAYATEVRLMSARRSVGGDEVKAAMNAMGVAPLPGFQFVAVVRDMLDNARGVADVTQDTKTSVELYQTLTHHWRKNREILIASNLAEEILDISNWDAGQLSLLVRDDYKVLLNEDLPLLKKEYEDVHPSEAVPKSIRDIGLFLMAAPFLETLVFQHILFWNIHHGLGGGFWLGFFGLVLIAFVFSVFHVGAILKQFGKEGKRFTRTDLGSLSIDEKIVLAWFCLSVVFTLPYLFLSDSVYSFVTTATLHSVYNGLVLAKIMPRIMPLASVIPPQPEKSRVPLSNYFFNLFSWVKKILQKRPTKLSSQPEPETAPVPPGKLPEQSVLAMEETSDEYLRRIQTVASLAFNQSVSIPHVLSGVADHFGIDRLDEDRRAIAMDILEKILSQKNNGYPVSKEDFIAEILPAIGRIMRHGRSYVEYFPLALAVLNQNIGLDAFSARGILKLKPIDIGDYLTKQYPMHLDIPGAPVVPLASDQATQSSYFRWLDFGAYPLIDGKSRLNLLQAVGFFSGKGSEIVSVNENYPVAYYGHNTFEKSIFSFDEFLSKKMLKKDGVLYVDGDYVRTNIVARNRIDLGEFDYITWSFDSYVIFDSNQKPVLQPLDPSVSWVVTDNNPTPSPQLFLTEIQRRTLQLLMKSLKHDGLLFFRLPDGIGNENKGLYLIVRRINKTTFQMYAHVIPVWSLEEPFNSEAVFIKNILELGSWSKEALGRISGILRRSDILVYRYQKRDRSVYIYLLEALKALQTKKTLTAMFDVYLAGVPDDNSKKQSLLRDVSNLEGGPHSPGSIFYKNYLWKQYGVKYNKWKAVLGHPYLGAPSWEWVFSLPVFMVYMGNALPRVVLFVSLITAGLFAASHSNRSFQEIARLYAVGFLFNFVVLSPSLFIDLSWSSLLAGVLFSIPVHGIYNLLVLRKFWIFKYFPVAAIVDPDGILPFVQTFGETDSGKQGDLLKFIKAFESYVNFIPNGPDPQGREEVLITAEKVDSLLRSLVETMLLSIATANTSVQRKLLLRNRALQNFLLRYGVYFSHGFREIKNTSYFEVEFSRIVQVREYHNQDRKVRAVQVRPLGRSKLYRKVLSEGASENLVAVSLDRVRRYVINTLLPLATPGIGYYILDAQVKSAWQKELVENDLSELINNALDTVPASNGNISRLVDVLTARVRKVRWLNSYSKNLRRNIQAGRMGLHLNPSEMRYLREMARLILLNQPDMALGVSDVVDGIIQINSGIKANLKTYDAIVDNLMEAVADSLEIREVVRVIEGAHEKADVVAHLNQLVLSRVPGIDFVMLSSYLLLSTGKDLKTAQKIFEILSEYAGSSGEPGRIARDLLGETSFSEIIYDLFKNEFGDLPITIEDVDQAKQVDIPKNKVSGDSSESGQVVLALPLALVMFSLPIFSWSTNPWAGVLMTSMAFGWVAFLTQKQTKHSDALAVLKSFPVETYFGNFKGMVGHVNEIENRSFVSWVNNREQAELLIRAATRTPQGRLVLGLFEKDAGLITQLEKDERLSIAQLVRDGRLEFVTGKNSLTALELLRRAKIIRGSTSFMILEGARVPEGFFNLTAFDWQVFQQLTRVYLVTRALQSVEVDTSLLPNLRLLQDVLRNA